MNNKVYHMDKTASFYNIQPRALVPEAVAEDLFKALQVEAEGKQYWLVEKTTYPYTVCQVCEFTSEEDFNEKLHAVLNIPNWAEFVAGDLTFLIHRGNYEKIDIDQQTAKQVAEDIHQSLREAAQWWHQYGADTKKGAL